MIVDAGQGRRRHAPLTAPAPLAVGYGCVAGSRGTWSAGTAGPEVRFGIGKVVFRGTGKVKSETAQRPEHFDPSAKRLHSVTDADVRQAVRDIPAEWGIGESDRRVWVERLLARRKIVLEIVKASNLTNGLG
jgi:hypothetical protein